MTHEELQILPLFLGMSKKETAALRADRLLTERSTKKGITIVQAGNRCDSLLMVSEGSVLCSRVSSDGSYSIEETLHAPLLVEPWQLFGMSQRYTSTYEALTPVTILQMKKNNVMTLMGESFVFRANYLNIMSMQTYRTEQKLWGGASDETRMRVVKFIKDHCQYPSGQKTLRIQMLTMARELGCSRLEVSQALHKLQDEEKIIIGRERIFVPMIEIL